MKSSYTKILALVLLHLIVFLGTASIASAFNNTGYKWSGTSVSYYINSAFAASFKTAMQTADATWDAAGSKFRFSYAGTTSRNPNVWGGGSYTSDGYNDIGYYNNGYSGVIATTQPWVSSGTTLGEVDLTLNTYYAFTTVGAASSWDVQSVVTHELGHWLYLGHVTDSASPSYCGTTSLATMCKYPYSVTDTYRRSLETDDKNGAKAIYGT